MNLRATTLLLCALLARCGVADERIVVPVTFAQALGAEQVKSYLIWAFEQVARDGGAVSCDQLISGELSPLDDTVVKVAPPTGGGLDDAPVFFDGITPGKSNRIIFVELFEDPVQLGHRIGLGCVEGVSIDGGRRTLIRLSVIDVSGGAP